MDLGTMTSKLSKGEYRTMADFASDMRLIFSNCRKFNPPGTFPVNAAASVESAFEKEWAKALEQKLAYGEKRSLQGLLGNLMKEPLWV